MNKQNFFFFKFSSEQGLKYVMEENHWSVYDSPVSLLRSRPGLDLIK